MAEKKKIALIGGAGFIGHNLALALKERGHEPHVIDSLHINNFLSFSSTDQDIKNRPLYLGILTERTELLQKAQIPLYVQDARDYHQVSHLLEKIKPDTVILLAAVAHADRSNKDPYSTFDHSLRTLENALDASRSLGVKHFVYFSSSMVYGNFPEGFVTEDTPCEPMGIYGSLKFAGEKIVTAYNQTFGVPYTIIRPSALYGERCVSRRVGQIFIESAISGHEIAINGSGEDRLDVTYIGDFVQGAVKVVENPASINQTFNITHGAARSINDLAEVLRREFPEVNIRYLPRDKLMPIRGTLSVEKAKRLIGYEPQFPIEKGFTRYINWYRGLMQKLNVR